MRFILSFLLTACLAYLAGLILPWWSIAIVSFLVALLVKQSPGRSFLAGFLALFILWGLLAAWIDTKNESILSKKIAQIFSLGESSLALILVSAVVGALVAGFAAMSGASLYPKEREPSNAIDKNFE